MNPLKPISLALRVTDEGFLKRLQNKKAVDISFAPHIDLVYSVLYFNGFFNLEFESEEKKMEFMKDREVTLENDNESFLKRKDFKEFVKTEKRFDGQSRKERKERSEMEEAIYVNIFNVPFGIKDEDLIEAFKSQFDPEQVIRCKVEMKFWHEKTHNGSRSMTNWVKKGARPKSNFLFPDVKGIKLASEWADAKSVHAWRDQVRENKEKKENGEGKATNLPRSSVWASSREARKKMDVGKEGEKKSEESKIEERITEDEKKQQDAEMKEDEEKKGDEGTEGEARKKEEERDEKKDTPKVDLEETDGTPKGNLLEKEGASMVNPEKGDNTSMENPKGEDDTMEVDPNQGIEGKEGGQKEGHKEEEKLTFSPENRNTENQDQREDDKDWNWGFTTPAQKRKQEFSPASYETGNAKVSKPEDQVEGSPSLRGGGPALGIPLLLETVRNLVSPPPPKPQHVKKD